LGRPGGPAVLSRLPGRGIGQAAARSPKARTPAPAGLTLAFEIDTGSPDLTGRRDNTPRLNLGWRVEMRDDKIGNSAVADEGTYGFDKGDLTSGRIDWLTELDVVYMKRFAGTGLRTETVAVEDVPQAFALVAVGGADAVASDEVLLLGHLAASGQRMRYDLVGELLSFEAQGIMFARADAPLAAAAGAAFEPLGLPPE
jgi:hypothetical protein